MLKFNTQYRFHKGFKQHDSLLLAIMANQNTLANSNLKAV